MRNKVREGTRNMHQPFDQARGWGSSVLTGLGVGGFTVDAPPASSCDFSHKDSGDQSAHARMGELRSSSGCVEEEEMHAHAQQASKCNPRSCALPIVAPKLCRATNGWLGRDSCSSMHRATYAKHLCSIPQEKRQEESEGVQNCLELVPHFAALLSDPQHAHCQCQWGRCPVLGSAAS